MNTTRSKSWNGRIESLDSEFLKNVLEKMSSYGERVQFTLSRGNRPNYQITNHVDKKIAFDGNHHLLRPEPHEFEGSNASAVFTLEQVKLVQSGGSLGARTAAVKRAARSSSSGGSAPRGMTAAARAKELIDIEKYNYFKANRASLPPTIGSHSDEITELMQKGMSAEEAFSEVVKRHF